MGSHPEFAEIAVNIFAVIVAFCAFLYQASSLQKMVILPVKILPFCSICIIYENLLSIADSKLAVEEDSFFVKLGYCLTSLIVPMFCITLFEIPYRLYETRSAQFFFIRFDETSETDHGPFGSFALLCTMRVFSIGLFALNILVYYNIGFPNKENENEAGFLSLSDDQSLRRVLFLIPRIFLSFTAIVSSVAVMRYVLFYKIMTFT